MDSYLMDAFSNFLETKKQEVSDLIASDSQTLFIDLEDVKLFNNDLYVNIHQNFIQKYEELRKLFKTFLLKAFNLTSSMDVSFYNPSTILKLRNLRSDVLGDLVAFTATVTRTTQVRPELVSGSFTCKVCQTKIPSVEQEFRFTEPLFCPNHLCSNRTKYDVDLHGSTFCNWQRVHVQECTDEIPHGSLPRNIDVIVRNELVEKIKPGAHLRMVGYLIVVPDGVTGISTPRSVQTLQGIAENKRVHAKELSYKLCFILIHAKVDKIISTFSAEEIGKVSNMRSVPNLYAHLSDSLFPSIFGHSNIKSAILLMLVGGVSKNVDIKLRGDINVLLVGDPGTAKSQFLKQTSGINPRSIYTSGKSSSAAGLTAAVVRDAETGEFTIEAGALMLSDEGVCCIDEFDKMTYKDQVSIHEAMEQQTITIAKAGINATLNSRTSILAAANPIKGRYDKRKTLRQNVNLSPPIMSRFDLYFVLIDEIDKDHDKEVSYKILSNHCMNDANTKDISDMNTKDIKRFTVEEVALYIKYVKSKKPILNDESKQELISKYISLRQDSLANSNNYKMTVRHLESLIRLSEALAKIHNDDTVRVPYIQEAYRLLKSSIIEIRGEDINLICKESSEIFTMKNKDYLKISNSLIYLIKSESLEKSALCKKYLEMVEESIENTEMLETEQAKCMKVIDFLIDSEGVLFEVDGKIYIHSDYDN